MELSGLGKYLMQNRSSASCQLWSYASDTHLSECCESKWIHIFKFCMLYVIHTKYMQCLNKLWGIIIKWTLVSVVPVLWGHPHMFFSSPAPYFTPEVASNFMHACFLIRGLSFTQHLTWELPSKLQWVVFCLFSVVMVNVFCPEMFSDQRWVFSKGSDPQFLREGLPHVNEEQFFN